MNDERIGMSRTARAFTVGCLLGVYIAIGGSALYFIARL
jgi:hypothetical protein